MTLADLGWDAFFEKEWTPYAKKGWVPARLIRDNKISYGALTGDGSEYEVVMSGKVYYDAETDAELPAVGDWVGLELGKDEENDEHVIRVRLPRKNTLSRKASGRSTEEQVIAANVDVVVVVTDAGPDFNLRRMERYFTLIGRSGAQPVVLVNKADLFTPQENRAAVEAIQALNPNAEVYSTSCEKKSTLKGLMKWFKKGVTVTFAGSSGVGKSTLINLLLGDEYQWTGEVNEVTGKGRHTTTARELMVLRKGGIIIDNPGIREVHMWTDETTLREQFADLEEMAQECQFHDCRHQEGSKGCAIQKALQEGRFDIRRLEGFLKLDKEIEELRRNRKKRQMVLDRRSRQDLKKQNRKYSVPRIREDYEED